MNSKGKILLELRITVNKPSRLKVLVKLNKRGSENTYFGKI
jgi:hypothetical protein